MLSISFHKLAAVVLATLLLPLVWDHPTGAADAALPPAAAYRAPSPIYNWPVAGRVVDGFRPPATPWASGNRGLEIETTSDAAVRAAASGTVTFAGLVAGTLHITVLHDEGIRTSYSFLADVTVSIHQEVDATTVVGHSAGSIHFSARIGDQYFDPHELFRTSTRLPILVPTGEPPPRGMASERGALLSLLTPFVATGRAVVGELDRRSAPYRHWLAEVDVRPRVQRIALALVDWQARGSRCTPTDALVEVPTERRIAVLVGGLGSTSESAAIDLLDVEALGYGTGDVVRFSYRGGRVRGSAGPELDAIDQTDYSASDTTVDLIESGQRLAELLEEISRSTPGVPIDVYAHSQGGVVARIALADEAERFPEVDLVATIGTPHRGADLATAAVGVGYRPSGWLGLEVLTRLTGVPLSPSHTSVRQLAETSEFQEQLHLQVVPPGVRGLSLAGRGDLVVASQQTAWPGAEHHVVDLVGLTVHSDLPGDPLVQRELALGLAGLPPTCSTIQDTLTDLVAGETISLATDTMALSAAISIPGP